MKRLIIILSLISTSASGGALLKSVEHDANNHIAAPAGFWNSQPTDLAFSNAVNGVVSSSQGPAGADGTNGTNGVSATIAIGSVETGLAGSSATVSNSGTSMAAIFDFSIPRGNTGSAGPSGADGTNGTNGVSATIEIGTVYTLAAGSNAGVTNTGTSSAAIFDFGIPRGNDGSDGSNSFAVAASASISVATNGNIVTPSVSSGFSNYVATTATTSAQDATNGYPWGVLYLGLHAKADTAGTADTASGGWPTEWSYTAITNSPWQPASANLTNWSALATGAKQDALGFSPQPASANLTNWSALTTASKQDALGFSPQIASANLTNWSGITTASKQDALGFSPQPASANLTNWSALTTTSKQDALGYTPGTNYTCATNVWTADTALAVSRECESRTNFNISNGAATMGIPGLVNVPASVEGYGQLTVKATGDITFTNVAAIRSSDFLTSRTITNGNSAVIGIQVIPGFITNLAIVQFK